MQGVDTTVVRRHHNTKVQAKKRKPGFSLVNPRVKRYLALMRASSKIIHGMYVRWHGDKGASIVSKGAKIMAPPAGSASGNSQHN